MFTVFQLIAFLVNYRSGDESIEIASKVSTRDVVLYVFSYSYHSGDRKKRLNGHFLLREVLKPIFEKFYVTRKLNISILTQRAHMPIL